MSSSAETEAATFDGLHASALAQRLRLPRVVLFDAVGSTLDVAHSIAATTESGTLVLADEQTAGRGRQGKSWRSTPRSGVWLTLIERPSDPRALDVLALRCGLYAAEALDALSHAPIGVKWPNDLHVEQRKLAGILIETRWRGSAPEWVAIGFGLNVVSPGVPDATGLTAGTSRLTALDRLVPALRAAASAPGHLSSDELARWASRDVATGRPVTTPAEGIAVGISADGTLLVTTHDGGSSSHRTGSLTFAAAPACS